VATITASGQPEAAGGPQLRGEPGDAGRDVEDPCLRGKPLDHLDRGGTRPERADQHLGVRQG
jgi:hypothetical protein